MKFDDRRVSLIEEKDTQVYFGEPPSGRGGRPGWPCAYMLLYEAESLLREHFTKS